MTEVCVTTQFEELIESIDERIAVAIDKACGEKFPQMLEMFKTELNIAVLLEREELLEGVREIGRVSVAEVVEVVEGIVAANADEKKQASSACPIMLGRLENVLFDCLTIVKAARSADDDEPAPV